MDYSEPEEYPHVAWAAEELESSARERAFAEAELALRDPFPEDHESRVAWAEARCHAFVIASSDRSVRDVYLSLAKHGMLGADYSLVGSCKSRLTMAIIARACGVPIRPENVFAGLEHCCQADVAVETYVEMMRHGHYPCRPEDDARLQRLAAEVALEYPWPPSVECRTQTSRNKPTQSTTNWAALRKT